MHMNNLGLNVLLKDTTTSGLEKLEIEILTLMAVDILVYLLNHSYPLNVNERQKM